MIPAGSKPRGSVSPKLVLVLVSLMFLLPLTVAWLMYAGVIGYQPGGHVNRGVLIDPPVRANLPEQVNQTDIAEHWILTWILPVHCDDGCRQRIHDFQQLHRALGRDAARTRILLLKNALPGGESSAMIEAPGPEFSVIASNTAKLSQQFESLGDRNGIFIIDPLGNIMMRYARDADTGDILFDLERLLQYQKTDPQ